MSGNTETLLAKVGVFSLLTPGEINLLVEHLATLELAEGQVLFREGDEGNDMFIIADGAAAVSIRLPDGEEREIARFAPGDFFGEMSIFDNSPRSASCRALAKSTLYSLSKDAFADIIGEHPGIAQKLMYRMLNVTTQRLRGTSEFVSEMVLWGEGARKRRSPTSSRASTTGAFSRIPSAIMWPRREKGKPLSLVMVDLDRFRDINEMYGHPAGDAAIKGAAQVFKSHPARDRRDRPLRRGRVRHHPAAHGPGRGDASS